MQVHDAGAGSRPLTAFTTTADLIDRILILQHHFVRLTDASHITSFSTNCLFLAGRSALDVPLIHHLNSATNGQVRKGFKILRIIVYCAT